MNQIEINKQAEKFEIYTGFRRENTIEAKLLVGAAFKEASDFYYKIRLMMFRYRSNCVGVNSPV